MRTKAIFGGAYVVYEDGRIWSNKTNVFLTSHGVGRARKHQVVLLTLSGKQTAQYVHGLVAEAFIENVMRKPEVNHKDGDPRNNHVSNLEWVTRSENIKHAYATGLMDKQLRTKKCKCGALIAPRTEICASCRASQKRQLRLDVQVEERNTEADVLQRFCKNSKDKRFLSLWRTGMKLEEIGKVMGVSRQCVDQRHQRIEARLNKYNECLEIVNE